MSTRGPRPPLPRFCPPAPRWPCSRPLLRFALAAAPPVWDYAWPVLWALALLTMAVGNLTALYQTQVKRLLAYSSIAQMGYLLMTLLAVKDGGAPAVMFYLAVYAVMDLGAFGIIGTFSGGETDREELSDYQGLGYSHPWRAGHPGRLPALFGGAAPHRRVHGETGALPGGSPGQLHHPGGARHSHRHRFHLLLY